MRNDGCRRANEKQERSGSNSSSIRRSAFLSLLPCLFALSFFPLKDLSEFQRVGFVMKDGYVIKNEWARP